MQRFPRFASLVLATVLALPACSKNQSAQPEEPVAPSTSESAPTQETTPTEGDTATDPAATTPESSSLTPPGGTTGGTTPGSTAPGAPGSNISGTGVTGTTPSGAPGARTGSATGAGTGIGTGSGSSALVPPGTSGTGRTGSETGASPMATDGPQTMTVDIKPTKKSKLKGTVKLEQTAEGVVVTVNVTKLKKGPKGVHLHENADCSAPDASSAGEHWNPSGAQHGMPDATSHHVGDLGNIDVDAKGKGELKVTIPGATLGTTGLSLVGRALVVHSKADDGTTQPAGDSGDRMGCAEITLANNKDAGTGTAPGQNKTDATKPGDTGAGNKTDATKTGAGNKTTNP